MEISERAAQLSPSLTLSIDSKAKAMKAEGIDVCGFGAGEPDFDTPEHIKAAAIEALQAGQLDANHACGFGPIRGLLHLARQRGLRPSCVDLRNSGDTAGRRDRVVGYGAFVFVDQ